MSNACTKNIDILSGFVERDSERKMFDAAGSGTRRFLYSGFAALRLNKPLPDPP